jgi:hypothetical protein
VWSRLSRQLTANYSRERRHAVEKIVAASELDWHHHRHTVGSPRSRKSFPLQTIIRPGEVHDIGDIEAKTPTYEKFPLDY